MNRGSLLVVILASAVLVLFQNCDKQKFSFEQVESIVPAGTADDPAPSLPDNNNNDEPPANPPVVGNGDPEVPDLADDPENPDYNDDPDYVYVPPGGFDGCASFVEIDVDTAVIPARTADGICYYKRLMSAIPNHGSGDMGEDRAPDVVSDNHDGPGVINPYIIADTSFDFSLAGPRNVAFSGAFNDPNQVMKIDNYFLIEIQGPENASVWAYGTADAEPNGGSILLNDQPVENFYSFAPGGTATVTAIDVSSSIPAMADLNLRFRALDCGGAAAGSDVFLVFY